MKVTMWSYERASLPPGRQRMKVVEGCEVNGLWGRAGFKSGRWGPC